MNKYLYGLSVIFVYIIGWANSFIYNHSDKKANTISVREWYAGMALCGMYAADTPGNYIPMDKRVKEAYFAADSMVNKSNDR